MTHRFESQHGDDYQTEQWGLQPSLGMVYVMLRYLMLESSPTFSWRSLFPRFLEPMLTVLLAIFRSHKYQHMLSSALPIPTSLLRPKLPWDRDRLCLSC